jgi:hypothetical protein
LGVPILDQDGGNLRPDLADRRGPVGWIYEIKSVYSPQLRADRPLAVEEEVPVPPGRHAVRVTFTPADPASGGVVLAYDRPVHFEAGRVVLITAASAGGRPVLCRHDAGSTRCAPE